MGRCLAYLVESFQEHEPREEFGCCFVCPGIGHYMEHHSTTSKRDRVLPSHWEEESWVQGGTRMSRAAGLWRTRDLCHMTQKGPPKVIASCEPDGDEKWWWRTGTIANFPKRYTGVQSWHRVNDIQDRFEISGSFA